jgi:hypothetical protein
MFATPVLQIQCQPDHLCQSLIISDQDRLLLKKLAGATFPST